MQVCALFLEAARHQLRVASLQKCHALPEPHAAHKILGHCDALLHDTLPILQNIVHLLVTARHRIRVASLQKCHALPEPDAAHEILCRCNALLHGVLPNIQNIVILLEGRQSLEFTCSV